MYADILYSLAVGQFVRLPLCRSAAASLRSRSRRRRRRGKTLSQRANIYSARVSDLVFTSHHRLLVYTKSTHIHTSIHVARAHILYSNTRYCSKRITILYSTHMYGARLIRPYVYVLCVYVPYVPYIYGTHRRCIVCPLCALLLVSYS